MNYFFKHGAQTVLVSVVASGFAPFALASDPQAPMPSPVPNYEQYLNAAPDVSAFAPDMQAPTGSYPPIPGGFTPPGAVAPAPSAAQVPPPETGQPSSVTGYSAPAPAAPAYPQAAYDPALLADPYSTYGYAPPAQAYAQPMPDTSYAAPAVQPPGYEQPLYQQAPGYDLVAPAPEMGYGQGYPQPYADPYQYGYAPQGYVMDPYAMQAPGYGMPYGGNQGPVPQGFMPPAEAFEPRSYEMPFKQELQTMPTPMGQEFTQDMFGGDNPFLNPFQNDGYFADKDFRPWSTGPFDKKHWKDSHPMRNMPWGNFPNWGEGFFGGFGPEDWRGITPWGNDVPFRWADPTDPKESIAEMWEDSLNTPNLMGRMPPGWTAPYISVPNPIDVADEFERNARNFPDEWRNMWSDEGGGFGASDGKGNNSGKGADGKPLAKKAPPKAKDSFYQSAQEEAAANRFFKRDPGKGWKTDLRDKQSGDSQAPRYQPPRPQ